MGCRHHKELGQLLLLGDTGPGTFNSLVALVREGQRWDSLLHPTGLSNRQKETALSGWLSKR